MNKITSDKLGCIINKPILYVSCGIPGSGKTTFLNKVKKEDEIIVSRDDIRMPMLKKQEDFFKHEKEVYKIFITKIGEGLQSGHNVYADATHLNRFSRQKLFDNLKGYFPNLDYSLEAIYFNVPIQICLQRNKNRTGRARVPEPAILSMANSFSKPLPTEGFCHIWIVDQNQKIEKEW